MNKTVLVILLVVNAITLIGSVINLIRAIKMKKETQDLFYKIEYVRKRLEEIYPHYN